MKTFLLILALSLPVYSQTSAELEVQIRTLRGELATVKIDSVVAALTAIIEADTSLAFVRADSIKLVNVNLDGSVNVEWVGLDLGALTGRDRTIALEILKTKYLGKMRGEYIRLHERHILDSMITLKQLLQ